MKRTWTIVGVADVARSLRWYQTLFGQPLTEPAHEDFGQVVDADGTVLLCLHQWGAHEHPTLTSPDRAEPGNGLLLPGDLAVAPTPEPAVDRVLGRGLAPPLRADRRRVARRATGDTRRRTRRV